MYEMRSASGHEKGRSEAPHLMEKMKACGSQFKGLVIKLCILDNITEELSICDVAIQRQDVAAQ